MKWPWSKPTLVAAPTPEPQAKEPERSPWPVFSETPAACPKCGDTEGQWLGPVYAPYDYVHVFHWSYHVWESLSWTCEPCGYVLKMQPKDAA